MGFRYAHTHTHTYIYIYNIHCFTHAPTIVTQHLPHEVSSFHLVPQEGLFQEDYHFLEPASGFQYK